MAFGHLFSLSRLRDRTPCPRDERSNPVTNPYIAGAAAERYLTDLFFQAETDDAKALAEHVIENVRRGEDGYPVLKIVGKNRLVIEFDLSVPPIGPKATAQAKQLVEAPLVSPDPGYAVEGGTAMPPEGHVPGTATIKPADPEQVEHPNAGETLGEVLDNPDDDRAEWPAQIVEDTRPWDPSHPEWPNPAVSGSPVGDLPHDQGYRSPWADKGDAARAKQELPSDPTEADLPAPLDQEYTTAQDAAGSSR